MSLIASLPTVPPVPSALGYPPRARSDALREVPGARSMRRIRPEAIPKSAEQRRPVPPLNAMAGAGAGATRAQATEPPRSSRPGRCHRCRPCCPQRAPHLPQPGTASRKTAPSNRARQCSLRPCATRRRCARTSVQAPGLPAIARWLKFGSASLKPFSPPSTDGFAGSAPFRGSEARVFAPKLVP
jgi:hypothetical protein